MRTHLRMAVTGALLALAVMPAAIAGAAPARSGPRHAVQETLPPIDLSEAENCDFIADPGNPDCMVPFPDDYYTVADPNSATEPQGQLQDRRDAGQLLGVHIEAGPYNASDGFSPGSVILLKVPGIDTDRRRAGDGPCPSTTRQVRPEARPPSS